MKEEKQKKQTWNPLKWEAKTLSKQKIADYKSFCMVDGEGVRNSVYLSGCEFRCPGCYNEAAWDFDYGTEYSNELEDKIVKDTAHESVQGVTLLGGEPFLNTQVAIKLTNRLREEFGDKKDIWSWSGYLFEQIMEGSLDKIKLLRNIDVLVDGPFMLEKKDLTLQFRGSSNQRLIDVKKSLKAGKVVLWQSSK